MERNYIGRQTQQFSTHTLLSINHSYKVDLWFRRTSASRDSLDDRIGQLLQMFKCHDPVRHMKVQPRPLQFALFALSSSVLDATAGAHRPWIYPRAVFKLATADELVIADGTFHYHHRRSAQNRAVDMSLYHVVPELSNVHSSLPWVAVSKDDVWKASSSQKAFFMKL